MYDTNSFSDYLPLISTLQICSQCLSPTCLKGMVFFRGTKHSKSRNSGFKYIFGKKRKMNAKLLGIIWNPILDPFRRSKIVMCRVSEQKSKQWCTVFPTAPKPCSQWFTNITTCNIWEFLNNCTKSNKQHTAGVRGKDFIQMNDLIHLKQEKSRKIVSFPNLNADCH